MAKTGRSISVDVRASRMLAKNIPIFFLESCPVCESSGFCEVIHVRYKGRLYSGVLKYLVPGTFDEQDCRDIPECQEPSVYEIHCVSTNDVERIEIRGSDFLENNLLDILRIRGSIRLFDAFLNTSNQQMLIIPKSVLRQK